MKPIIVITFMLSVLIMACQRNNDPTPACATPATVKDMRSLDGCGFVFELNDGTLLEPYFIGECGTLPLSKEITDDPLYNFEFRAGTKVLIGYEAVPSAFSVCMVGEIVKIKCLTIVATPERLN